MQRHFVHGFNSDVDLAAAEDIWTGGGAYPFPASALATTIVSGSANDTAAGTGARTVRVIGLDASFAQIQETVSLNGATPVNLALSYFRILRVFVLTAGSGGTNAGALSVKQSSTTIAEVVIGQGRAQMAVFTAGSNSAAWMIKKISLAATNAVAGSVVGRLWTRKAGAVWQVRAMLSVYGTTNNWANLEVNIGLDAGEDVRLEATTTADNTAVAGHMEIDGGSASELG